jgi:Peptidase inhibitor family I36
MNKYSVFIVSVFFVLLASAGFAVAEDRGDRICIYKQENFKSHEQCYRPGDEVSDLKHAEISSIRVFGHARATIFENRDFRGRTMEFSADIPDLKRVWHEDVGSLRVTSDYVSNRERVYNPENAYGRHKPYPSSETIEEGVCVYERPNFQGRFQCWASGTNVSDLGSASWRDKISSVRVFGHARLAAYKDPNFRGEHILVDHDVPDLAAFAVRSSGNWNHEIASVEVE